MSRKYLKAKKKKQKRCKEKMIKKANIQLTPRDVEMLSFINQFGFCEIGHIQKQFNLKKQRSYYIMKRLIHGGLLNHQRIFYGEHGVYFLTEAGASHTPLPALSKLSYRHYHHHLKVIDVAMRLTRQYPESTWISERQLLIDKFKKGQRAKGHVADGVLHLPEDKKMAIEVELSRKGQRRLERILKKYATAEFDEVWYYCSPVLFDVLERLTQTLSFIKVFNIEGFLT
jgi:DNA-binding MarR family transcriptional regulator